MTAQQLSSPRSSVHDVPRKKNGFLLPCSYLTKVLLMAAIVSLLYGAVWNYSTRRYLKGFSDAIVPLDGSAEEKSEALLGWFREEPDRRDTAQGGDIASRDPVGIVQDARLLKICGSASNAFINLADVAGLKTRRLLLLDASGSTTHVVVEVQWGDRWVVVDPSFREVFRDETGRALTKEDLRDPALFKAASNRIPRYDPAYTFTSTAHIHLARIPLIGNFLRQSLKLFFPDWEEIINWGYFPENPSLWPILFSIPLFLLAALIHLLLRRYGRVQSSLVKAGLGEPLIEHDREFSHRSA